MPASPSRLPTGLLAAALAVLPAIASATVVNTRPELEALFASYTLEDFETLGNSSQTISGDTLTNGADWGGYGAGLVAPGVEYSAPGATLHWNVDGFYGLVTRTLGDAHNGATWIVYTQSVTAMGFDLHGYDGYPNDAVISVYDLADDLVFSGSVTGGVGATNTFFGYEHAAGIGRVTVDAQGSNYMMIDNHAYGVTSAAVPAPAAAPLLVAALGGLAAAARRRRRG